MGLYLFLINPNNLSPFSFFYPRFNSCLHSTPLIIHPTFPYKLPSLSPFLFPFAHTHMCLILNYLHIPFPLPLNFLLHLIHSIYLCLNGPAPSSRGNLFPSSALVARVCPQTAQQCYLPCVGYYGPRRWWPMNREGGQGHRRGLETVMNPTGRPGPAGWGRAERPQKYSSVRREGIGTRTVVRGKGEGGTDRDGHHDQTRVHDRWFFFFL